MDSKAAEAPSGNATTGALHASLAAASSADNAAADLRAANHHWSVLSAILLIVIAVAWSLIRQRSKH